MLVDDSASATVRQLGDALTELEVHGHFFGRCSLTLVLHGTDPRALQHQTAEAMKAMAVHDGSLFEETYNLLNAWLSIVPGNGAHNLRRLALLETNLADLSFLFTLDHGDAVSPHLGQRSPGRLRDAAPDAVRLQPARAGRRSHAGARRDRQRQELPPELPDHARAEVRRRSRSSSTSATAIGSWRRCSAGATWSSASGSTASRSIRSRSSRRRRTCTSCTRSSVCCSRATTAIASATSRIGRCTKPSRTSTCSTARSVGSSRWPICCRARWRAVCTSGSSGGRYAGLFDNVDDTLTVERLQVFDFEAMRAYPLLLEPLLFYVLHRVVARIQDPAEAVGAQGVRDG